MKKLALALVAATAMVGSAAANAQWTGFYVGANTGYDNFNSKFELGKESSTAAFTQSGQTDMGKGNANFGFFAGYNWLMGCTLFGGEIGFNWAKMHASLRSNDTANDVGLHAELKSNHYFTFAARLGYLLSPTTAAYVRIGGNYRKWNNKFDIRNAGVDYTSVKNKGSHRLSFAPGFGLETALNRNVLLRAEWTYEWGGKCTTMYPTFRGARGHFKRAEVNSFKVGVAYKF